MLSQQDNELLTRTGRNTSMGNLMRRYWILALLDWELPRPDSDPLRLRLLGEDLVAFRDTNGQAGRLAANCPDAGQRGNSIAGKYLRSDGAPKFEVVDTPYGFVIGARRDAKAA